MRRVITQGVFLLALIGFTAGGAFAQQPTSLMLGEPFQESGLLQLDVGEFADVGEIFTVPPGKLLVLRHVGVESRAVLPAGSHTYARVYVFETGGSINDGKASTIFKLSPGDAQFAGDDKMTLMFAEEGESIGLELRRNGTQTTELFRATLTGFLIDAE